MSSFTTPLGTFDRKHFAALVDLRQRVLDRAVGFLKSRDYTQVTTSSLVNIAGSCENPYASFPVNYYGRTAHLSQSAQIQLEFLVLRLQRPFFTINNSFREEHFDDPGAAGRRLSEFTLIEPERPYPNTTSEEALAQTIREEKNLVSHILKEPYLHDAVLSALENENISLKWVQRGWIDNAQVISYDAALDLLNTQDHNYKFGDDLGIKEERALLQHFDNYPVFITHFPASLKFFNLKRTPDGARTYSADLLLPPLGETIGGGVREEDGKIIKKQYLESKVAAFLREKDQDPLAPFAEYFSLFEQEKPLLRAGYGLGFERFIGFLLNSNDILETIACRTLRPE